jgi:hypothetical protein
MSPLAHARGSVERIRRILCAFVSWLFNSQSPILISHRQKNDWTSHRDEKIILQRKGWLMSDKKIAGWKRWHFKSRIILMLLGAVAIIVYLLQSGLAKQYAGVGAALCAIACGGFLVWHLVHLFAEEDAIEEQQIDIPSEKTTNPSRSTPQ